VNPNRKEKEKGKWMAYLIKIVELLAANVQNKTNTQYLPRLGCIL